MEIVDCAAPGTLLYISQGCILFLIELEVKMNGIKLYIMIDLISAL